jgi:hypothetical protein
VTASHRSGGHGAEFRLFARRHAPQHPLTRVILIRDEIFIKVGRYVLGNLLVLHEVTIRRLDRA